MNYLKLSFMMMMLNSLILREFFFKFHSNMVERVELLVKNMKLLKIFLNGINLMLKNGLLLFCRWAVFGLIAKSNQLDTTKKSHKAMAEKIPISKVAKNAFIPVFKNSIRIL